MTPPPPPVPLAGQHLLAGISHAEVLADLDFETYSAAGFVWDAERNKWRAPPNSKKKGLFTVGAALYSRHPTTEVLTLAYDLKDGAGRRRWRVGMPPPADLFAHVAAGRPLEAWNVGFERWVWENVAVPRMGWPPVQMGQWRCAMAKARSYCLPGKLSETGAVLALCVQKDKRGEELLEKFSWPRDPTKTDPRTRIPPVWALADAEVLAQQYATAECPDFAPKAWGRAHTKWLKLLTQDHEDTLALLDYNETDIESEAEASGRIPDLDATELGYWQDDQAINHRGVAIDVVGMESCIALIEQCHEQYNTELRALTGGLVGKASELAVLSAWLRQQGVPVGFGKGSMDEEAIDALQARDDLPPQGRRALEIRAAVGSASVKKVFAMRNMLSPEGRLHDLYIWAGARTARPTGSGPQPTNLPKAGPPVLACKACGHHHKPEAPVCPWCSLPGPPGRKPIEWNPRAAEDALVVIHSRSLAYVEHVFGDAMAAVSGVLRGLFIAPPGKRLISSDFSAIEGVVIAALAGEQWRLEVFAGHGKIYEMSAAKIMGLDFNEMLEHRKRTGQHHPARQNPGKIAELGLGFGGWINAWKQFDGPGTDDEIKANIIAWREASPAIVYFWGGQNLGAKGRWAPCMFGLEGMAISAVQNPGTWFPVHRLDGTPTGIAYLCYGDVLHCRLRSGRSIAYHRPRLEPAEQAWRGLSLSFEGWNSNPKNGPMGWQRMGTYSGRLAENVVQATARDIQMHAIHALEALHYPIVLHTYDEVVAEVAEDFGTVEELEGVMAQLPAWAAGWPIKAAGGWAQGRYCKA